MKCTGFLSIVVVLAVAIAAEAGPHAFSIRHIVTGDNGVVEDFSIANYEFGSTDWIDDVDDGVPGTFFVEVNSGSSLRPGFSDELTLDYANYDIGFFGGGPIDVLLEGVPPGKLVGVFVKDEQGNPFGNWSFTDNQIQVDYSVTDVLNIKEGVVTIQWSTAIPEPATGLWGMVSLGMLLLRRR